MAGADILKQFAITPEKRALLNNEVHQLMPELTQYFRSLQARRQKGEVMTIEKCKDFYNYSNLLDSLMLLQAGVILPLRVSPVVKRYKLVFGDYVSENFLCFIEKQPFQEKLESQPHYHYYHHHHHQRIMLELCYRLQKALFNRFGFLINFILSFFY